MKRAYWEANKNKIREKGRAYYYQTKEHQLAGQRVRYQKTRLVLPWLPIFNAAKARAKAKNIPFDLTHDWMRENWTGKCALTGIEFINGTRLGQPRTYSGSLDRIDPKKGYTMGNVRVILHSLNAFKGDDTDAEMYRIARALISNEQV